MHGSGVVTQVWNAFCVTLTKASTTARFAFRYSPLTMIELP